jgi:hypothetical protein
MADIVRSSGENAKALMRSFQIVVNAVNKQHQKQILSPLTITLGDEFQGIVRNVKAALQIIFDLEQHSMTATVPFTLRYVLVEGVVETGINKAKAHGMLGPGLTEARERLNAMKTTLNRFEVALKDTSRTEDLNLMLVIMQGIANQWTKAQKGIVATYLRLGDYKLVAEKLRRDPTSAWRRQRSLMITEYNAIQTLMIKTASRS